MQTFLKNNLLILIFFNFGNAFNYLFQIVAARGLTAENFGVFNSLNSLAIVISAPIAVFPFVFSKYTAQYWPEESGRLKSLLVLGVKFSFLLASGALAIGFLAAPWIKNYLHISVTGPVFIMIASLGVSLIRPVFLGTLRGLKRFMAFGIGSNSFALVRFLSGALLIWFFSFGVNGALFAGLAGGIVSLVIGVWALNDIWKISAEQLPKGFFSEMSRYAFPVLLASAMVKLLGNLDIVLVRHYCSAEEAGLYAIAAVLGRIALFLPRSLVHVLFPDAVKDQGLGAEARQKLWTTLGLTFLLGGGFSLLCILWPELILTLLFGEKYKGAAPLLQVTSIAMALLAIANVLFIHGLARSKFKFLWPLTGGAGLMTGLIFFFHDTALTIAHILLLSIGTILTVTFLMSFLTEKRPHLSQ